MPSILGDTLWPTSSPSKSPVRDYSGYQNLAIYSSFLELRLTEDFVIKFCRDYKRFSRYMLDLPFDDTEIAALRIHILNEDMESNYVSEINATCNDFNAVNFMLTKISTGAQFVLTCGGFTWRLFTCSGSNSNSSIRFGFS
jgi:hypothetical protein